MRLTELNPRLLTYHVEGGQVIYRNVETVAEAQGLQFLCPVCFRANGGPVGTHMVCCWNPTVPDDASPGPGRWTFTGTSFEDLSVMEAPGKTRSIQLHGGCNWHGYVTNGEAHE